MKPNFKKRTVHADCFYTYMQETAPFEFIKMIVDEHRYGRYSFVQIEQDLLFDKTAKVQLQVLGERARTTLWVFDNLMKIDTSDWQQIWPVYAWFAHLLDCGACSILYQDRKGRLSCIGDSAVCEAAFDAYAGSGDYGQYDHAQSLHDALKPFFRVYGGNSYALVWKSRNDLDELSKLDHWDFCKLYQDMYTQRCTDTFWVIKGLNNREEM